MVIVEAPVSQAFTNTKTRKDKNRKRDNHKVKKFPTKVEESLTGRVIAAHGDIVRKLHNVEEAQRARDAFTKVSKLDQEDRKKGPFALKYLSSRLSSKSRYIGPMNENFDLF